MSTALPDRVPRLMGCGLVVRRTNRELHSTAKISRRSLPSTGHAAPCRRCKRRLDAALATRAQPPPRPRQLTAQQQTPHCSTSRCQPPFCPRNSPTRHPPAAFPTPHRSPMSPGLGQRPYSPTPPDTPRTQPRQAGELTVLAALTLRLAGLARCLVCAAACPAAPTFTASPGIIRASYDTRMTAYSGAQQYAAL